MKNDKKEQAFKSYIDVTLEEYKSLRNESMQCNANIFTSLYIGFAAIGVLCMIGFPLIIGEKTLDSGLFIFGLFIPIMALGITFLILTEAMRFKRIGDYICFLEIKLSLLLKDITENNMNNWTSYQVIIENKLLFPHVSINLSEPLIWERWLRECPKKIFTLVGHLDWIYKLRIGLLGIISFLSLIISVYYYINNASESKISLDWFDITTFILFYVLIWLFIYYIGQKITKTSSVNMNEKDN